MLPECKHSVKIHYDCSTHPSNRLRASVMLLKPVNLSGGCVGCIQSLHWSVVWKERGQGMESWDIAMLSMSLGSVSLSFCFFKFWVNQALPLIFQMSLIWAFVAERTFCFFPCFFVFAGFALFWESLMCGENCISIQLTNTALNVPIKWVLAYKCSTCIWLGFFVHFGGFCGVLSVVVDCALPRNTILRWRDACASKSMTHQ